MSKKTERKRRKMDKVPGSDFTATEFDVSLTLRNTYEIERSKHNTNKRLAAGGFEARPRIRKENWEQKERGIEEFESESEGKFWLELAKKVIAQRCDPAAFIRRQFMLLNPSDSVPPKNHLKGARAFGNYRACKELSRQEIVTALTMQRDTARVAIVMEQDDYDKVEACVEVLWDFDLSLSPLFRYCLALQLAKEYEDDQFEDIANRFLVPAALQYIEDAEAYDVVWGRAWLPAGFRGEATRAYDRVYGV